MDGANSVSRLLFVDDLLCISKMNTRSIFTISIVLSEFGTFSGLQSNAMKSGVYFSITYPNKEELASLLGFLTLPLPFTYLGMLFVGW